MTVDSHIHLFRNGYPGFAGRSPLHTRSDVDAYEELAARHGIDAALVVCYEEHIDPGNNSYVRDLARHRPWISSVAYLSPDDVPSFAAIDELLCQGHLGVALYVLHNDACDVLLSWPPELWRRLARSRGLVSLNIRPEALSRLAPVIEYAEDCVFLISHLGLPGRFESVPTGAEAAARLAPLLLLAQHNNVGVKLSGFYAIDPVPPHRSAQVFLDLLLDQFPPQHLHWGSDFSPVLGSVRFEDAVCPAWLDTLDAEARDWVMGKGLALKIAAARDANMA